MSKTPSFRSVRRVRTLNLLAQVVLFLTLFAGINYLAIHYVWRFDLTKTRANSLSAETLSYLKNLKQPVRFVVTLTADNNDETISQAYRDVSPLLREYSYSTAANPVGKVTIDFIDVFQRRRDAEALGIDKANVILVLCGDRRRVIPLSDLYDTKRDQKSFMGEKVFTSAILDVSSPKKKKIYFLTGHGELDLEDTSPERGLSVIREELKLRNFDVDNLDLAQTKKIPEDAAVLVIAGPQGRYDPIEEELIRQYLSTRAGRLLALLPPGYPNGLDNLLFDWGILVDDVLVWDPSRTGQNETGDLILPGMAKQPITESLLNNNIPLRFGLSRSARPDPGRSLDASLIVNGLVATSPEAWGERNYRDRGTPVYNEGIDLPGRITVVTSSERNTLNNNLGAFSVPDGRMVVFGSADWIANGRIGTIGNISFFISSINWTTDRDVDLKVAARPVSKFQLSLNQQQLQRLRFSLIFALPGLAALIGIVVYWTRRN